MSFGRMGAAGFGFGRLGSGGGIARNPLALSVVVLTWTSTSADTTPDFDVDLPSGFGAPTDAAAGDVLRIQYQLQSGGAWTDYVVATLSSGDISADIIPETGITPLANGDYFFRARIERGANVGPWSSSASVTIAAVTSRLLWSTDQLLWGADNLTWS